MFVNIFKDFIIQDEMILSHNKLTIIVPNKASYGWRVIVKDYRHLKTQHFSYYLMNSFCKKKLQNIFTYDDFILCL